MRQLADRRPHAERNERMAVSAHQIEPTATKKRRGDYGKPRGFEAPMTIYQQAKMAEQRARMEEQ